MAITDAEYERIIGELYEIDLALTGISSAFSDLLGPVIESIRDRLREYILDIIGQAGDVSSAAIRSVQATATGAIDSTEKHVVASIDFITTSASDSLGVLVNSSLSIHNQVTDSILDTAALNQDLIVDLQFAAIGSMEDVVLKSGELYSDTADNLVLMFESVDSAIQNELESMRIRIDDQIIATTELIETQTTTLTEFAMSSLAQVVASAHVAQVTISGGFNTLLRRLTSDTDSLIKTFQSESDETQVLMKEAIAALSEITDASASGLGGTVLGSAFAFISSLFVENPVKVDILSELTTATKESPVGRVTKSISDRVEEEKEFFKWHPLAMLITVTIQTLMGFIRMHSIRNMPLEAEYEQDAWFKNPSKIPEVKDALLGYIRQELSADELMVLLKANGFSTGFAEFYRSIARVFIPLGDMIEMQRRGFYKENDFDTDLGKQGFDESDQARIKQILKVLPPLQDIITMLVREVFDPQVTQLFRQFEDYPEQFTQMAAERGLSEDDARNYWAAHWALPGAEQGFKMLHRHIIDMPQLEALLKALDVMPFWRDKLIQLSYTPIGRVDIRRIDAMFDLDEADLQLRYEAFGYSPLNADLMVQWTKRYNAPDEGAIPEELKGLTRATVMKMYRLGMVESTEAVELMVSLRIGEKAAQAFVDLQDLSESLDEREAGVNNIINTFSTGGITLGEATDKIGALGLTISESQKAIQSLQKELDKATKMPSEEKLTAMVSKRIITVDEYILALHRHGYPSHWVDKLVILNVGESN